jgi:hypothetical protein
LVTTFVMVGASPTLTNFRLDFLVLPEISEDMIGDLRLLGPDEDDVGEGIASGAVSCRVTRLRFSEHGDFGKDSEGRVTDQSSWDEPSTTSPDFSSPDYQLP